MKEITITIDDKKAMDLFTGISERAKNPIEINKIIALKMREDVLNHFRDAKGSEGKWKDLKPATWKAKLKKGHNNILMNTGTLRMRNVPEAGKDYAMVWNDLSYAGIHQNGTKNVPQRDFLWLSSSMLNKILKLMANYIVRKGLS